MSNTPLSSFASAATGSKLGTATANVKISSAELLSMLKKPTSPTTTAPSLAAGSLENNLLPVNTATESKSVIHPFQDDDYTLQGLVNLIKACQSSDRSIYALGVDLENDVGLSMNQSEPLRESLISPWYDEIGGENEGQSSSGSNNNSSGLLGIEGSGGAFSVNNSKSAPTSTSSDHNPSRRSSALDSIIPSCYHVPSLPAPSTKISGFADETLFYIFYAMPGDKMQELAARELFGRGWRFHKPTKSWMCPVIEAKDVNNSGAAMAAFSAAQTSPVAFFLFDQSTWIKVKRSLTLQADDLEFTRPQHSGTASPVSSPEIMHGSGTLHSTSVTH